MDLGVNLRLPALFESTLVIRAFEGCRTPKWVRRHLNKIGAVEIRGGGGSGQNLCDPEVIRSEWPTIYHRCVELILEDRMRRAKPAPSNSGLGRS